MIEFIYHYFSFFVRKFEKKLSFDYWNQTYDCRVPDGSLIHRESSETS